MKVSIIVLTHNNDFQLNQCIKAIKYSNQIQNGFTDYEIIVVNNKAMEKTIEFLNFAKGYYPNFKVINTDRNLNYSQANNLAVKMALGEWLCFLHDD